MKCSFVSKTKRKCPSPGKGIPPLCPKHFKQKAQEATGASWATLLDVVMQQPKTKVIFEKVDGVLEKANGLLAKVAVGDFSDLQDLLTKAGKQRVVYQPEVKEENPRVVLGFKVTDKLTASMIKDRRRELAKILHPDKGGSDEAMQRMNVAADKLLKEVGG